MIMPMVQVRKVGRGVVDHFPVRASEWGMLYLSFTMGLALFFSPNAFDNSVSYRQLANWMDEREWAFMLFAISIVRFIALVVNGTFPSFRISPELRFLATMLSAFFWSQFALGFAFALEDGGSVTPVPAYTTFILFELFNIGRATHDWFQKGLWRK